MSHLACRVTCSLRFPNKNPNLIYEHMRIPEWMLRSRQKCAQMSVCQTKCSNTSQASAQRLHADVTDCERWFAQTVKDDKSAEFTQRTDNPLFGLHMRVMHARARWHICILHPLSKHQALVVWERSSCGDISAYLIASGKGIILIF